MLTQSEAKIEQGGSIELNLILSFSLQRDTVIPVETEKANYLGKEKQRQKYCQSESAHIGYFQILFDAVIAQHSETSMGLSAGVEISLKQSWRAQS